MSKELIIPPSRAVERATITVNVPGVNTGGPITSAISRAHYNRTTKTVNALTTLNVAETKLTDSQTQLVESTLKHRESLFRLQEQPEKLGHELAVRRVERDDAISQVRHQREMNETNRRTELTVAVTVLTDAQQQLKAQQEHGYYNHELNQKKKTLEMLDLELSEKERREHYYRKPEVEDDEIDEALYARRDQLNAAGLDTSRIEAVIKARKT